MALVRAAVRREQRGRDSERDLDLARVRGLVLPPTSDVTRPERVREGDVVLRARPVDAEEEDRRVKRGGLPGKAPERAAPAKKTVVDQRLGRQRLTLSNALDEQQRERSLASLKRQRERQKLQASGVRQERVKI